METQRRWVDNYASGLNRLTEKMQAELNGLLLAIDADSDTVLQEVQSVMFAFCESGSAKAAGLASAFYDGLHTIQMGEPFGAEPISSYNPKATAIATAGIMKDGLNEKSKGQLLDRLAYEIKRSAGECVIANALKESVEDG